MPSSPRKMIRRPFLISSGSPPITSLTAFKLSSTRQSLRTLSVRFESNPNRVLERLANKASRARLSICRLASYSRICILAPTLSRKGNWQNVNLAFFCSHASKSPTRSESSSSVV